MNSPSQQPAVSRAPQLLVDTLRQVSSLLQGEVKLARAEVGHIAQRACTGLVFLAIAILMALVALNILASAAVAYLATTGLSVGVASLVVSGSLLVLCAVFALTGKARLSAKALTPEHTIENLRADIRTVKEQIDVRS